jgi:hypothetical protein
VFKKKENIYKKFINNPYRKKVTTINILLIIIIIILEMILNHAHVKKQNVIKNIAHVMLPEENVRNYVLVISVQIANFININQINLKSLLPICNSNTKIKKCQKEWIFSHVNFHNYD